jgi:hypothetical protein
VKEQVLDERTGKNVWKVVPRMENDKRPAADDSRTQGAALQDCLFEYLHKGLPQVVRGDRKVSVGPDRLEPEEYALEQEKAKAALKQIRDDERNAEAREQVRLAARALDREKADLVQQQAAQRQQQALLDERQKDLDKQASVLISAKRATGRQVEPELDEIGRAAKKRRQETRG